ncbi:DUF3427 domain-containing protein [Saccharospirillum alexandrii]|uniref:DUF3427 domain-containing protein n=1 Tax=Saccharospirillum alexandrii TaxID=2448477 RepID=UPI000FDA4C7B|nr:DUF3427 domain-containing protein [Saccharospirillum alexandrii]
MDELYQGLYDLLATDDLHQQVDETLLEATYERISEANLPERLATAVAERLLERLHSIKATKTSKKPEEQLAWANQLLASLQQPPLTADTISSPPRALRAVHPKGLKPELPAIGLAQPWLFTAGKDSPALLHELQAELNSCNHVDILVSFITVSGVRKLLDRLKAITATDGQGRSQASVRVLTTTYTGATDQKALNQLAELPNCEVRVSLDGRRTRLHAKAWLFERDTGFGSAYVGSANFSGAALMGGLEWTVKFTEHGQPDLFSRAKAHFETLWLDTEFQPYDPNNSDHQAALRSALKRESTQYDAPIGLPTFFDLVPKPFQTDILEQLDNERAHERTRNLLVAATGTGKTVMAAFDYRRIARQQGGQPRLLFVAHREEILKQARHTYRQVLHDPNFGDLLTGHHDPEQHNHLFATIQSLQSQALLAQLGADYWQVVVIDECHHIEAKGFEQFVTTVEPAVLLGLTATPERHDGKNILRHFHNRPDGTPAAQLRLWHALDLQLLAPFEYYGCDDGEDYRTISWGQPQLEQQQLSNLLTGNQMRARTIINNWRNLVADTRQCKALAFCVSVEHAEFMTEQFNQAGIAARLVTGKTNRDDRNAAPRQLQNGEINVIVTVDLYNEGIDLPFVDTLLLLRPTQSATVFQQQIGRGLRLYEGKESCLVLDFVGQYQDGFRFDTLYSSITGLSRREIADSVEHGFAKLPSGCHLQLHKTAREHILHSLKQAITQNWRRLQTELARYAALKGSNQVSLSRFLTDHDLELEDIYQSHSTNTNSGWTNLLRAAGLIAGNGSTEEAYFSKRFAALLHQDDPAQWELLAKVAEDPANYRITSDQDRLRLQMLAYQIDSNTKATGTAQSFLKRLANEPHTCQELKALAEVQQNRHYHTFKPLPGLEHTPLRLHAAYQLREILSAVGRWTEHSRPEFREGVLRLHDQKTELIFITLDKSEARHEGVAYHDYAISRDRFHWQTQNSAGPKTDAGKRYLEQKTNGWQFQLFVRTQKGAPYRALGPAQVLSSQGGKPMSITLGLEAALPERLFEGFSVLRAA